MKTKVLEESSQRNIKYILELLHDKDKYIGSFHRKAVIRHLKLVQRYVPEASNESILLQYKFSKISGVIDEDIKHKAKLLIKKLLDFSIDDITKKSWFRELLLENGTTPELSNLFSKLNILQVNIHRSICKITVYSDDSDDVFWEKLKKLWEENPSNLPKYVESFIKQVIDYVS